MATAEHIQLVTSAYRLLLDRDPEPAGLRHWSESLANGLSKAGFLRTVISSSECRSLLGSPLGNHLDGVDLMLSIGDCRFVMPAQDQSLVPYLLKDRVWEPAIIQYLTHVLTPSDLFVDVGANLGYYTAMLSPLVKQVVAFEPVGISYKYCKANVELNGRHNVVLHNAGLWDREMDIEMTVDHANLMVAHVGKGEIAHCVTLDQLELDPRVIKMDIEGAEVSALSGMTRTLARSRPTVIMELNRPALARYGADVGDVWGVFTELDYAISLFHEGTADLCPVQTLDELFTACPADALVDIAVIPRSRKSL